MSVYPKVAIMGSGSWATALAKLVLNNTTEINWFVRSEETIDYFRKFRHNPKYISDIEFDISRIHFFNSITDAIASSDILVFAIPAPFLKETLGDFRAFSPQPFRQNIGSCFLPVHLAQVQGQICELSAVRGHELCQDEEAYGYKANQHERRVPPFDQVTS